MGFNAIRKHMKVDTRLPHMGMASSGAPSLIWQVDTRRWFAHADRLGFLVWQDIPQQGLDYARFAQEVRTNWAAHRGSPPRGAA